MITYINLWIFTFEYNLYYRALFQNFAPPFFKSQLRHCDTGTKNALFGYLWASILRNYSHISNQYLEFDKKEFLTHTVNFGIGPALNFKKKIHNLGCQLGIR